MSRQKLQKLMVIPILVFSLLVSVLSIGVNNAKAMSPLEAIEKYKKEIVASARKTGVWASVTAAQLMLESGNPMSDLATKDNNFFGIKWSDKHADRYPGAKPVKYSTKEHQGGGEITIMADFTHFPSPSDGITEHSIIWWNGNYQPELDILYDLNSSMDSFLKEMANGPYATDVTYYSKLRSIIDSNNLEDLDKLAFPNGRKFCGFGDDHVGTYSYPNDGYNADDLGGISNEVDNGDGTTNIVIKEEDLPGMYADVFFQDGSEDIELPTYEGLTTQDKVNLINIQDNLKTLNEWTLWDNIRVMVVFIGLVLLGYAVIFLAGYMFDSVNNFIDISLVSIFSFGHLCYSNENSDDKRLVNRGRMIKIECAMFGVGFFLISGALFSFILDAIFFIKTI